MKQKTRMTEEVFKSLVAGDVVAYNGAVVTVKCWLHPEYYVEYTNGTNTKITDPWLDKMWKIDREVAKS